MTSTKALAPPEMQASEPVLRTRPTATAAVQPRNEALDFTKGSLVLIMVFYHWLNYFVSVEGEIYKYLRFLTPSFIFITGFIISHVYLARHAGGDRRVYVRLLQRGVKLLLLFTVLNVLAGLVIKENYNGPALGIESFLGNLYSIYVLGNGRAIFDVLVPISYVLLLAPVVLLLSAVSRLAVHAVAVVALLLAAVANVTGTLSPNLALISIGMLGMMIGTVSIDRIEALLRHPIWIALAYAGYAAAVARWDVLFPLQILGVCLSLLLIYLLGTSWTGSGVVRQQISELGNYSLLAYIAQVAILQLLRRALAGTPLSAPELVLVFFVALAVTVAVVRIVALLRMRSTDADRLYRAVFA